MQDTTQTPTTGADDFQYPLAGRLECKRLSWICCRTCNRTFSTLSRVASNASESTPDHPIVHMVFQYPLAGRLECKQIAGLVLVSRNWCLSVPSRGSPRMQARKTSASTPRRLSFQYPLAGRLECKAAAMNAGICVAASFSTLSRVASNASLHAPIDGECLCAFSTLSRVASNARWVQRAAADEIVAFQYPL